MITRKPENQKTRKRADFNIKVPKRKSRVARTPIESEGAKKNFYCFPPRLRVLASLASSDFIGMLGTARGSSIDRALRSFSFRFPRFLVFSFAALRCPLLPHRCPCCRKVCGRFLNTRCRGTTIGDGRKFRSHR